MAAFVPIKSYFAARLSFSILQLQPLHLRTGKKRHPAFKYIVLILILTCWVRLQVFWTVRIPQTTVCHLMSLSAEKQSLSSGPGNNFIRLALLYPWRRKVSIHGRGDFQSAANHRAVRENSHRMTHYGIPLTRIQPRTAALSSLSRHARTGTLLLSHMAK